MTPTQTDLLAEAIPMDKDSCGAEDFNNDPTYMVNKK
jgi:hypothetical protein